MRSGAEGQRGSGAVGPGVKQQTKEGVLVVLLSAGDAKLQIQVGCADGVVVSKVLQLISSLAAARDACCTAALHLLACMPTKIIGPSPHHPCNPPSHRAQIHRPQAPYRPQHTMVCLALCCQRRFVCDDLILSKSAHHNPLFPSHPQDPCAPMHTRPHTGPSQPMPPP